MPSQSWTTDLTEIRRDDDSERIGFLRPIEGDLWEPLNLLGMPLAEPTDSGSAENQVRGYSMPSLIEPLWCKIPRPLVEDLTDARQDFDEARWERVAVVETNSDEAIVRPYYPMSEEEQTRTVSIQLPADDVLKFKEPSGSDE